MHDGEPSANILKLMVKKYNIKKENLFLLAMLYKVLRFIEDKQKKPRTMSAYHQLSDHEGLWAKPGAFAQ